MASILTADPPANPGSLNATVEVRIAGDPGVPPAGALGALEGLQGLLEPAILACEAAIAYRVREGTRPPAGGLLTSLVDAVEVGQTALDLARRSSPLVPAGRDLARLAFGRAEAACRERGDAALLACAEVLRDASSALRAAA